MPSTPSLHNHGGTGEQEARLRLPLHHFEQAQDQPPDSTFVTSINSRTVDDTTTAAAVAAAVLALNGRQLCSLGEKNADSEMQQKMYRNKNILSPTPGGGMNFISISA